MLTPSAYRRAKTRQSEKLALAKLLLPVILLGCVMWLTGCATNSLPPEQHCPTLPAMPSVDTPQPSVQYSESVRLKLKDWQDRLKATPLTR